MLAVTTLAEPIAVDLAARATTEAECTQLEVEAATEAVGDVDTDQILVEESITLNQIL
jgi:hypothetical protein